MTTSTVQNVVGSFNINGTRANQHEYTVDGVTNLNLGNNTGALVSVNPDALEEVKILTSNYQAEYGRAGGGFIALTTRGGHQRVPRRPALLQAPRELQRQQLLQQRQRPAASRSTATTTTAGTSAAPCRSCGTQGRPRRCSSSRPRSTTSSRRRPAAAQNIRVPTAAERGGDFSQTRDGTGNADRRSAIR